MNRTRQLIGGAVLLIGLTTVAVASPATTPAARAAQPSWLTIPSGLPLFDLAGIAPGDSGSSTITVANPQPFPVTLSLKVTGVANDDNGCNPPEQASGDTTCGAGGGELQTVLRLALSATGETDRPITEGTVDEWAGQVATDTVALGAYESRTYRVGYELPIATANEVQSDLVSFQFEVGLEQVLDQTVSDPPPAVFAGTLPLPKAGTNTEPLIIFGFGAILIGTGLYTISAHRRRSQ